MANSNRDYFQAQHEAVLGILAEKRADRDERQAELEVVNQEIVQLEQLLKGFAQFIWDVPAKRSDVVAINRIAGLPLAEACRAILKAVSENMTARAVRDSLEASGYNLKQHANPLASIHGVLKRLGESGDVEQLEASGKTFYRWKGSILPEVPQMTEEMLSRFKPPSLVGALGIKPRPSIKLNKLNPRKKS